jgi:hypothetical protein
MPKIKAYWWKGVRNFGDALAPFLIDYFCNAALQWGVVIESKIVTIGSILEHIPFGWRGYICGAGRLKSYSQLHLRDADILALRGPLSARGIKGDFALGDPGLLADELVGPQEKIYDLGIVPHWKDKELVPRFLKMFFSSEEEREKRGKPKIIAINPSDPPLKVVAEIGSCRRLVTSSLHGMIVADAFGMPRRVEVARALLNDTEGGDFKFRDYSASIRTPFEPGKMTEPSRWSIEDTKHEIYHALKLLEKNIHEM